MNLIYLSHRIPYPPNKGDKIRSFNQIKYLAESGHDIHLVCLADNRQDLDYSHKLRKWCKSVHVEYRSPVRAKALSFPWLLSTKPLSVPYFYSPNLQKKVDRLLEQGNISTVFCFSSVMGEYVLRSRHPDMQKKLLVLDYCDLDSDKWLQYSSRSSWPMSWIYSRESSCLLQYEIQLNRFFDHCIFVSQAEADLFHAHAPRPEITSVIANGVDQEFFSPALNSRTNNAPVLLFTGAMDYQANVDGVVWFCTSVLPELIKNFPGLRMYVVGGNPAPEVKALDGEHITVTGYVKDIRDYYKLADVCVVPLRLARGVQNKVLEAMAMSRPVVSTSRVLQGVSAVPGREILVADDGSEFVEQISRVLKSPGLGQELGRRGRRFVLDNHDWQRTLSSLDTLLASSPHPKRIPPPARAFLSPAVLVLYVLFMFVAGLWPMQETSPGASVTYLINPGLQNFLHLPMFGLFALLLMDFLRGFRLSPGIKYGLFAAFGLGMCVLLEVLQVFVPGRFFSLGDILVNVLGLGMGLGLYSLWQKRPACLKRFRLGRHEAECSRSKIHFL